MIMFWFGLLNCCLWTTYGLLLNDPYLYVSTTSGKWHSRHIFKFIYPVLFPHIGAKCAFLAHVSHQADSDGSLQTNRSREKESELMLMPRVYDYLYNARFSFSFAVNVF